MLEEIVTAGDDTTDGGDGSMFCEISEVLSNDTSPAGFVTTKGRTPSDCVEGLTIVIPGVGIVGDGRRVGTGAG
jgi:hypothetical protein